MTTPFKQYVLELAAVFGDHADRDQLNRLLRTGLEELRVLVSELVSISFESTNC